MINVYVLDSLSWYRMLLFISIAFLTSLPKINTTPDFVFSLTCKTFNERICLFLDFYLPWQKIIVFESLSGKFKKKETTTFCKTMICIRWYILVEIRTKRKALLKHQLEWELWKKAYKSPMECDIIHVQYVIFTHLCHIIVHICQIIVHIWLIIVHSSSYINRLSSYMFSTLTRRIGELKIEKESQSQGMKICGKCKEWSVLGFPAINFLETLFKVKKIKMI